jgi:hypothetical protein
MNIFLRRRRSIEKLYRSEPGQKMTSLIKQLSTSLKEDGSANNINKWAQHIIDNNVALMDLAGLIDFEKPVALRFSWLIGTICELDPKVVYPAITHFYAKRHAIQIPNFNRSLAKMFLLCGIPGEIEGEATDDLFKWLLDARVGISAKHYALLALYDLSIRHPELKHELKIVIENQLKKNSLPWDKKANKILEKLG